MVPPPKKFSELLHEDDLSFKIKIEDKIEKLKRMEDNVNNIENFEEKMQSFMAKTKEKKSEMPTKDKVEAVDNLVDLFIQGNALRAKQMTKHRLQSSKGPSIQPHRHFTDLINGNLFEEPKTTISYDFAIGSSLENQGLFPKERQNPLLNLLTPNSNDMIEKNQLTPPKEDLIMDIIQNPEDFQEDLLSLPQKSQNNIIEQVLEMSDGKMDVISKLAPLKLERNPLLRILEPNNRDTFDRNNLSPPTYRQDPLLRQLEDHPEQYSEDFLQLPQQKQEKLIETIKKKHNNINVSSFLVDEERNPLKRLLLPNIRDELDKSHFIPPAYRQDPLLKQLRLHPVDFNEDFLELPMKDQNDVIKLLETEGVSRDAIEDITEGERNPLAKLVLQTNKVGRGKMDPLLRKFIFHPEHYKDDILQLPSKKQDTLLKLLRKEGSPERVIKNLLPPAEKRNPLLRILNPTFKDEIDKNYFNLPKYKQDPLLRQLIDKPEDYSDDFLELPLAQQDEIAKIISQEDSKFIDSDMLVPPDVERNPLMRLLEPNNNDDNDKNNLNGPDPKQDPLLKQLANEPMNYQDDFLELPRVMRVSLIQLLKKSGVRSNAIKELEKLNLDELPSLKELLAITSKDDLRKKIDKVLIEKPESYARIFSKLFNNQSLIDFHHTKEEILDMIKKDQEAVAEAFTELIYGQKKFTESSTSKFSLTSLFTTLKPGTTESSVSKDKVKILTHIIKKPKNGNIVKNANFSKEKVERLRISVKPNGNKDDSFTSKTVYKTKDGKIIPTKNIKLDEVPAEEIIIPDKMFKFKKPTISSSKESSDSERY